MNRRLSVVASVALGALCASAGCSDDPADPNTGGGGASAGRSGGGGAAGTSNVPRGGSAGSSSTAGANPEGGTDAGGTAPSNAGAGGEVAADGGEAGAGGSGGDSAGGAGPVANITLEAVKGTLQGGDAAKTLYFFGKDLPAGAHGEAVSACVAACNDMWPVYHEEAVVAGEGLSSGDFDEFVRPDGKPQTTFKGWPLYSHAADTVAGDRIGDGKLMLWHAAEQPFYSLVLMQAMIGPDVVTYMADGAGHTIYKLTGDTPGNATTDPVSTCTMPGCVRAWPTTAPTRAKPVSSITGTFDIFIRETLAVQLSYNGYPLYSFIQDLAPGDVKGFGKPLWAVATP